MRTSAVKAWAVGLLLAILMAVSASTSAAVQAQLDRNPVMVGEVLTLVVRASGETGGEPDFAPLARDFSILGQSSGTQISINNGRRDTIRSWTLELAPRRQGALVVPSLSVGNERTQPINVQVIQPDTSAGQAEPAMLEFSADVESPWVRQQVVVTVRAKVAGNLASGSLSEPTADGAVIEQLGEQSESQEIIGGTRYRVFTRRYVLFPERSGTVTITPPQFNGEISDGRRRFSQFDTRPLQNRRRVFASAEPITLEVQSPPPQLAGRWLPARDVSLIETLIPANGPYTEGTPFTRTVTLRVDGQLHTQITLPAAASGTADQGSDSFQIYPEEPQGQTATRSGDESGATGAAGVIGQQVARFALIPNRAGELQLPGFEVPWWDVTSGELRTATLPARTVTVAPGAGGTPPAAQTLSPATGTSASSATPWQWATTLALLGWLATGLAWAYWASNRARPLAVPPSESNADTADPASARQARDAALASGDPRAARAAVIAWARAEFREPRVQSLRHVEQVIAARCEAVPEQQLSALREELAALDSAAYGGHADRAARADGGAWSPDALKDAFVGLKLRQVTPGSSQHLPPLYPTSNG